MRGSSGASWSGMVRRRLEGGRHGLPLRVQVRRVSRMCTVRPLVCGVRRRYGHAGLHQRGGGAVMP